MPVVFFQLLLELLGQFDQLGSVFQVLLVILLEDFILLMLYVGRLRILIPSRSCTAGLRRAG